MGLRARLAFFFVAITVVPLTMAVAVLQLQTSTRLDAVRRADVVASLRAAADVVESARVRAGDLAADLANDGAAFSDRTTADAAIQMALASSPGRADVVVFADAQGRPVASRIAEPQAGGALAVPTPEEVVAAARGEAMVPGLLLSVAVARGGQPGEAQGRLGWVAAGVWADQALLEQVPMAGGGAFVVEGAPIAAVGVSAAEVAGASLPREPTATAVTIGDMQLLAAGTVLETAAGSPPTLVVWMTAAPGLALLGPSLFVLLPAVVAAALIGWLLAGAVVAPVRRAADVARAVAAGDLKRTLEPKGGRELADLATALNIMSSELDRRLDELRQSRDELRRSLSRLGETLSSSLDLNRTLAVVVETAMDTLDADGGLLRLFTAERDALYAKVGRGVDRDISRVPAGAGLAGHVARTGSALRLPADAEQAPQPALSEPRAPYQLAVPMVGRGRVIGVFQLLRRESADPGAPAEPFTQDDLDTLRTFAAQASVAMENVMLHQEAQRLSVTDALTGLWNFRYFQLQAERELESAARFDRPLALLIVDLDHFKDVNDRFGHQVGDDVLVEVARRIQAAIRVPDVVARYGGEEFVILLPGTDYDGAMATAERIRSRVARQPVEIGAVDGLSPIAVSCSVGVSTLPDHGATVAALLRSADAAMYGAKTLGRDRVVGADSTTPQLEGGRAPSAG